ncbi:hypothetical protein AB0J90_01005 [Micromonospora sp. NPDC049523]|uniref:hypothetical protein n=1 Tax=Micromonospora sp. NPDC049523 TaxID=3155921 RepID=UPI003412719C
MSRTATVSFGDRYFWTYDVSLSILVAETVAVAEELPSGHRPPWLAEMLTDLRVTAVVTDSGLSIGDGWPAEQVERFVGWVAEAGRRLAVRGTITEAEAYAWKVLDDHTVAWRGEATVDTGPVVQLAEAVIALVNGTLPPPPDGHSWFYGLPDGPRTLPQPG